MVGAAGAQSVPNADRATELLGTWSCESIAHSMGNWVFKRNGDGSLTMKNNFKTEDGLTGEFDERYRVDSTTGQWTWSSLQPSLPGFQESGKADPWTADKWVFEGNMSLAGTSNSINYSPTRIQDLRMIYSALGNDAFRREFEVRRDGRWVTFSASTCVRTST